MGDQLGNMREGGERAAELLDAEPLSGRVTPVLGGSTAAFGGCSDLNEGG